jgi:hypothetical protein
MIAGIQNANKKSGTFVGVQILIPGKGSGVAYIEMNQ